MKIRQTVLSLSLAASFVLCGGLMSGCSKNDDYALQTSDDVYSFAATTSAVMLADEVSSSSAQGSVTESNIVSKLDKYIGVLESVTGHLSPDISGTENDSRFSSEMNMSYKTLGGETVTYTLLYNLTQSDDNATMEGEITVGDEVYSVTAEKTVTDNGGTAVSMITRHGDDRIEFNCVSKDGEQQISYGLYKDDTLTDELKMSLTKKDGKVSLGIETDILGIASTFDMTCDSDAKTFDLSYTVGSMRGSVSVTSQNGSYNYQIGDMSFDFNINTNNAA